jgi:CHAD domain-containing protein
MAKAEEIDVNPDEPYRRAGARIVRVRTQELFDHGDGVLDTSDIERVHDMRVASRRLRAVLEIFAPCFPKAEFNAALRDVKKLADALGERRDPDVHLDAMKAFRGIAPYVERLRERQEAGNGALAAELAEIESSDLRGRLLALADAAEQVRGEAGDGGRRPEAES